MFIKSLIYLTIVVIIATLNKADVAQAKTYIKDNKLTKVPFSPEALPGYESFVVRMRRGIELRRAADESDMPKNQLYTGSFSRFRRQATTGESDMPKELQVDSPLNRPKRQMPSPPGDMPMPPM